MENYFNNIEPDGADEKRFVTKSMSSLRKFMKFLETEMEFVKAELSNTGKK